MVFQLILPDMLVDQRKVFALIEVGERVGRIPEKRLHSDIGVAQNRLPPIIEAVSSQLCRRS